MGGFLSGLLGSVGEGLFSASQGAQQRDFIKKQRKTAYQDTMADMRAAGLNPILAYKRGPTTGGQASLVSTPGLGQSVAAGQQASSARGIRRAQAEAAGAQAEAYRAQAGLSNHSAEGVRLENIVKKVQADYARSPAGKIAIHGKMIGGSPFGPAAAATAEMVMESLKGPPRAPEWLTITPSGKTKEYYDKRAKER